MEKEFEESGGKWKKKKICELFTIVSGKQPILSNRFDSKREGMVNTITGATTRNGINFYSYSDQSYNNELTISKDGEYAGTVFLQTKPFIIGGHCMGLIAKIPLSNLCKVYISTLINKFKPIWRGKDRPSVQKSRLEELEIDLPFFNRELAFSYMENYIKTLEAERIETLETYLQVTNLKDYKLTINDKKILDTFEKLNDTKSRVEEWREYTFEQLFNIYTGRDVIIGKTEVGDIPLISHQHQNNGIAQRIKNLSDRRLFDNKTTLSLADRGVFCSKSQSEKFHIGTRVKALEFKDGEKNKEVQLFFVSTINKLQILFTEYSSNATDKLPDLNIQLPTKNGEIDYQFMSDFIRVIKKIVIKDVVEWTNKKVSIAKERELN